MEQTAPTLTDEAYATQTQTGNAQSFGVLVERYQARLLRYGRKFLATQEDIEDIVQDVFVSAYKNIRSFDTTQRFSPWIYRIAHNAFVNRLKKNHRSPFVLFDFDTLLSHPVYDDSAEKEREQKEMRAMIDKGLEVISPTHREVLILYYLEELKYNEIADVLQIPIGTASARLARAKKALRDAYAKLNLHYES
jgi:RNA polymerase sigma-70 factor (ECF subfamily)